MTNLCCRKFTSSIPGCWERNANQSLSVTPVEPHGQARGTNCFADSLRERWDLVARHPDRNHDLLRSGLKPWLSAVGVKPFIYYSPERLADLTKVKRRLDPISNKFIQKLRPLLCPSFFLSSWDGMIIE